MRQPSMARNCFVAAQLACLLGPAVVGAVPAGNLLAAVWKEQHLDFVYQGRTVQYSCDGLREKVRAMLLDLGARRDVRILPGCEKPDADGSAIGPRLSVVFSSPALPDGGAKPAHDGDLAATDARFVPFTITNDAFRNMGIGDCELVQEFARQVLPKLVTREVTQSITCVPSQQGGSRFWVRGDILKALPRAEQSVESAIRER